MKSRTYCALIGDMNKSRELPQRARVQRKFKKAIDTLNREFKKEIASKFVLTLGDEFQGLLTNASSSYRVARRLQMLMGDVSFAFGVGIGALATPLNSRSALGMDGEAFHRARAALLIAKRQRRTLVFDFSHPALPVINALIGVVEKGWTLLNPTQLAIAELLSEGQRQVLVAKRLKLSQQYISKALHTTTMREMIEAESAMEEFLHTLTR